MQVKQEKNNASAQESVQLDNKTQIISDYETVQSRITLRFDKEEQDKLNELMLKLRLQGIEMGINKLFKIVIKEMDAMSFSKKIIKLKTMADDIRQKADDELRKIGF